MKQFKIYESSQESHEAVKIGWSWPAFFFGFVWALVKEMWALGLGVLGAFFVLWIIGWAAGGDAKQGIDAIMYIGGFILDIVFGVNGNKWREANLASRNYDFKDIVSAANSESAIALYLKNKSSNQNS